MAVLRLSPAVGRVARVARRVLHALRPRGTPAATGLAALALAAAVAFLVGAAVTSATHAFLHFGSIDLAGAADPAETERVIARIAGVFAGLQVGLAALFLFVAFAAWRGDEAFLRWIGYGPDFQYAVGILAMVFGGFALNFFGVALAWIVVGYLMMHANRFEEPTRRGSPDAVGRVVRRRRAIRAAVPFPQEAEPGERPLGGHAECPQCGTPNPVGRRRCRMCAQLLVPLFTIAPKEPPKEEAPAAAVVPRKRRRRRAAS